MSYRMTKRQKEALDFIRSFDATNEIAPTFDEIRTGLGLASKSGVHRLVTGLEERGLIKRLPHRARSIELTEKGMRR
jgi:repressor LexA